MSVIELWAYNSANTTLQAVLHEATNIRYMAELRGPGAGAFEHPAESAKAAYVTAGAVMRVVIDNVQVGAFVIEQVEEALVGDGARMMQASGRGLLSLFERAIVWPEDAGDYTTVQRTYLAKTFAYIIDDLVGEATTRGVTLPGDDFSATVDSNGDSWTDSYTLAYRAGTTLLEVILQHADLGVDVTIGADGTLHYWLEAGTDKSSTVLLREARDVLAAGRVVSHKDLANAVIGEGQYSLTVQTDATSISTYGRRERWAQFGNVSNATQLQTFAQLARDEWKDPATQIDLRVTDDTYAPFVDYGLGDTVAVRLPTSSMAASYRVRAIAVQQVEGGVNVDVTLNTLIAEYRERIDRALRRALMSPVESVQHGNSDPLIGGWQISATYLIYDTGTAATSAGLAPLDWPFYAGQVYGSRSSAPFRVSNAGALTATNATITGTVTANAGSIGGWTINSAYIAKDTGTAATSAGLAPSDYPFYAGQTYANRASAPFRVSNAGALTATNATITGTINFGGGKGVLDSTGFSFANDADNYVKINASNSWLLEVYSNQAEKIAKLINNSTSSSALGLWVAVEGSGTGGDAITATCNGGKAIAASAAGSTGYGIGVYGTGNKYGGQFIGAVSGVRAEATFGNAGEFAGPVVVEDDYIELDEMTEPSAPAANGGRLYLKDNGSGKTQLCVRFNTGAVQVLATQP